MNPAEFLNILVVNILKVGLSVIFSLSCPNFFNIKCPIILFENF